MLIFFNSLVIFLGVNFFFFCNVVKVLGKLVGVFCFSIILLIFKFKIELRIVGLLFIVSIIMVKFG